MKSFSLKKSIFSALLLTSFSVSQAMTDEEIKQDTEKQTFTETLMKVQPSINNGVKTVYKITKKTILPLSALYLFMKYLSPLGKQCFGSKKEEPTPSATPAEESIPAAPSVEEFDKMKPDEKFSKLYSLQLANSKLYSSVLANNDKSALSNSDTSDNKSPEVKTAEELLKLLLSACILDAYFKPQFKAFQETIEYYVEKAEEKLGLA